MTVGVFLANSARTRAMERHAPHLEAMKSTTTYQAAFFSKWHKKISRESMKSRQKQAKNRKIKTRNPHSTNNH
jgi:vacuolar-type H+-ATPase catalytic subunit A/Vma1